MPHRKRRARARTAESRKNRANEETREESARGERTAALETARETRRARASTRRDPAGRRLTPIDLLEGADETVFRSVNSRIAGFISSAGSSHHSKIIHRQ